MNEDDAPTVITIPSTVTSTSTSTPTTITTTVLKRETSESSLLCKTRYKFWVLSAILLLAFWSMFTGSITLKWSTGDLSQHPDNLGFQTQDDVDILVVEEKKKLVWRMWDVYKHSNRGTRLPRFWERAFQAAYEALASDVTAVRDAAVSEIAKLSISSTINLDDPFPVQSTTPKEKNLKSGTESTEEV
ncbi:PREDICTED: uncharacterized protein LOC105117091 [Populus euphratica]|uniref:Uncharacterized protein LOC105117091 n=1 Tax=Populus euphratica TaxID=75702 RepID=A0AAJ6TKF4_POPEU|nr:PREDICTED: uncharacterized protein LOC105117091 [Populus euphratica]